MSIERFPFHFLRVGGLGLLALLSYACKGGSTGVVGELPTPTPTVEPTATTGDDDSSSSGDDDSSPSGDDDSPGGPSPTDRPDFTPPDVGDDDSSQTSPTPGEVNAEPSGFFIVGSFPQNGAMLVPQQLYVQIFFSEPYPDNAELCPTSALSVKVIGTHTDRVETLTNGRLSEDGYSIGFGMELWPQEGDFTYLLEATLDFPLVQVVDDNGEPSGYQYSCPFIDAEFPLTYAAEFRTDMVCGQSFNIYNDLTFVTLGGDDKAAAAMNTLIADRLDNYPTALIMEGIPQSIDFPVEDFTSGLAGIEPSTELEGAYKVRRDTGTTSAVEGSEISESGKYTAAGDRITFPIDLYDTTTLYLYIEDATMSADLSSSGNLTSMQNFVVKGYVLSNELYQLLAGAGYSEFYEQVVLDIDVDGDGFPDAASIEAHSAPEQVKLEECP